MFACVPSGVQAMLAVNRKRGRPLMLLLATSLGLPLIAQQHVSQQRHDTVWTWSAQCNAKHQLRVTVHLQSKLLYEGLLSICRGERDAEDGRAEFHFSSDHVFSGEYRARRGDSIEGDIWQAGGETDALVLGVSLATKKQVVLNTLHIARPDRQTSAELDTRLYITTTPVTTRQPIDRKLH
jgi:hypothetical protein